MSTAAETSAATGNWSLDRSSGRQEFLRYVRHMIANDPSFVFGGRTERRTGVTKCIYQLVAAAIKRQLKLEAAVNLLADLVFTHHDMPSLVLDVFGILDAETSISGDTDERNVFCSLVKEAEGFLSENLLKERMEIDTLQDVGTVKNRTFYTRFIKVKTKLYYKQRRFNLFREESEGYAKLITELNQDMEHLNDQNALEMVKSLIGCFNLDPNRVLDIIIESFEMHPGRRALFIPLLQNYVNDGSTICEVLGYKFRHFADSRSPYSLFKVTAILLQAGVFTLDEIFTWLSPDDSKLLADWKQELADAKEYVRKLNVVALNKDKDDDEEKLPEDRYAYNQKWRLCEALLDIGDWDNALVLIKKLPDQSVMVHEPVAKALCSLLNIIIDPIYRLKCPLGKNDPKIILLLLGTFSFKVNQGQSPYMI